MTVTQSYSLSLTYTSLRMYIAQTPPTSVSSAQNTPAAPAGDTVTLSPEATTPSIVDEVPWSRPEMPVPAPPVVDEVPWSRPETPVPGHPVIDEVPWSNPGAPVPPSSVEEQHGPADDVPYAPPSRATRRAEALRDALDSDQDGTITKEEFVEGAMALLRRAGARHRYRDHHVHGEGHDHHGHGGHRASRLERRLDRLFDRVDAGGDGTVDQAELTDALAKVTRERRRETTEETPAPTPAPEVPQDTAQETPSMAISYTNVTVVIAVKQYASVAAMNA
jgi:hypothetical protein